MAFAIKLYRKTDKTRKYPCSKRTVKAILGGCDDLHVSFGLSKTFEFDWAAVKLPRIAGTVIASATVDRRPEILEIDRAHELSLASVYLYSVSRRSYPEGASAQFSVEVLPELKRWILGHLAKPETAVLGIEEIIIEWDGVSHRTHEVKLRY